MSELDFAGESPDYDFAEYAEPCNLTQGLAEAQEADAHAKTLKRSFYVETAETYGVLARDLADMIVNKGFTYSDADVYRFARLAGHFGSLV